MICCTSESMVATFFGRLLRRALAEEGCGVLGADRETVAAGKALS